MSEKITVNVPHKLTRIDARSRIDKGFGKIQEQIAGKSVDVTQEWDGDTMMFTAGAMGQKLTGQLVVFDDRIAIEVNLPWILARLSGGMAEKLKKTTQALLTKK